jgi:hypothetical protein
VVTDGAALVVPATRAPGQSDQTGGRLPRKAKGRSTPSVMQRRSAASARAGFRARPHERSPFSCLLTDEKTTMSDAPAVASRSREAP